MESGAVVTLSPTQEDEVSRFVRGIIFRQTDLRHLGEKKQYRKTGFKKPLGAKRWTGEDEVKVAQIMDTTRSHSRERKQRAEELARELNRTPIAIMSCYKRVLLKNKYGEGN